MKHLASLHKYFWKYRWRFLLGALFILLTNYFRILSPQLTGYVVNTVVHAIQGDMNMVEDRSGYDILVRQIITRFTELDYVDKVLMAGILLLVMAIISGFFMFLMRQTIIVMSRLIEFDQKNEIYRHYQKLDTGFYKMHITGDLMNRISEDVSRVRMYTGPSVMYFINLAAVIGFSVFFMYRSDPRLTFYALAPFPILAVIIYFVNTLINRKSERIQQMLSLLTANAQEAYTGIRVIKSFVQEKAMFNFFAKNSETYKNNALSLAKTEAIYFPTMGVLVGLSTLVTIYIGAMDVVNGVPGASVGKIAEFVMYIQMLSFPVSAIGWTASMTQRAATSQRRINEFLNTVPSIADTPDAKAVTLNGDIQFQHVSFQYQNTGIQALKDVSLSIRSGEKIAIVGRTGSGKTTLLQLLLRLYEADKGDIILDGLPIRMIKRSSLREGVSYVPQEVFLFSDTIYNNIIFAKPDATQQEVETAAKAAGIHDEILRFPQGYQTMVGERGVMLSGGQKQRISIARALIKSSPILIFDDSLSAVDSETENRILQTLHQYVTKRTAIIVTHRLFSLENMDRIYVMVAGEIAEAGTHVELLAKGGVYAEMYERQQNRATGKE
jgi:ATP-binding cassette subfamily B multidrug efflux pump